MTQNDEGCYGFRPKRSAHQAVAQAQADLRQGDKWVVALDLEEFVDRVNHDVLLRRMRARAPDRRRVALIHRVLKAGVFTLKGVVEPTGKGTPQGSPLSPLLANLPLDDLDRELEKRGHRFARYADDGNIYVRSRQAGERVMASVTRFLERKLKLTVNTAKCGRPPVAPEVPGIHLHPNAAEPPEGECEGARGLQGEGPGGDGTDAGTDHAPDRGRAQDAGPGLARVLRVHRSALAVARPRQMDPSSVAELPLETVGASRLP
jgi:hypothetical protein